VYTPALPQTTPPSSLSILTFYPTDDIFLPLNIRPKSAKENFFSPVFSWVFQWVAGKIYYNKSVLYKYVIGIFCRQTRKASFS